MNLKSIKRVVIKIGSSSITNMDNGLNRQNLQNLAHEVNWLKSKGKQVVIVSSGAISLGLYLSGKKNKPKKLSKLQHMASVGQIELMQTYKKIIYRKTGSLVAQVLLTSDDLNSRERFLNAKNTLNEIIKSSAVPIINENDTVAYDEIQFGDNDLLAAMVTNLVEAELLVLFTDQDGVFDSDPNLANKKINLIDKIKSDDSFLTKISRNSSSTSVIGKGGIKSKILAAKSAAKSGANTIIAKGVKKNFFQDLFEKNSKFKKTIIFSTKEKLSAKKKWMIDNSKIKGKLVIDSGAVEAIINNKKSLLPIGVISFNGNFKRGDLLSCYNLKKQEVARGLSNFSSSEMKKIIGKQTKDVHSELNNQIDDNLIHRDNLVII